MPELRRMRVLLGTYVEVVVRGPAAAIEAAIDAAFTSIARSQALWSFHDPDSELSRLNGARGQALPVSPASVRLLSAARAMMRASGGAFDCTVGAMLVQRGALPDHGDGPWIARGSAGDIVIGAGWARLARPVRLTLDGVAKGFAVDLALRAMRRAGATAGWVNAGGDMAVFGDLLLPVQRREHDGSFTRLGNLRSGAMASSRSGPSDPDFPSHIIAHGNGAPPVGVWTVVARSAWRADALTKVAAAGRASLLPLLGGALVNPAAESMQ
jgi:thiamine biosynthesis lipoprotein